MEIRVASPCLLLLLLAWAGLCQQQQCRSPNVHFSASSYRNASGYWISQAAVTHKAATETIGQHAERTWQYAVDFTRVSCADQDALTTTFSVSAPPPRVGSDYKYFRDIGYYKLHTQKLAWEDARKACSSDGAHLAVVNSEAEESAIRELMGQHSKTNFPAWIGFNDIENEGVYVTVLGELLSATGRVRWAPSEPNNVVSSSSPEGEDCGNIYLDGTINDARCTLQLEFVCEQSI